MRDLVVILLLASLAAAQAGSSSTPAVAPVSGTSWLNHLHRFYGDSSMGKTWRLGSSSPDRDNLAVPSWAALSGNNVVILQGADLYRLNCQGCHGPDGLGAPPEIASLVNPIRSTSYALVSERMKKAGAVLSRKDVMELVKQSQASLLERLHQGGTDMPAFPHLSELEIRAIVAYLNQLAGVPGAAARQISVRETPDRVGELLVKSTCHICHDATGANPTPERFEQGEIPPLSALPARVSRAQLVQKVTQGAAAPMNSNGEVFRGRMPVFDHVSANEAAAVYQYLLHYPPMESTALAGETSLRRTSIVAAEFADNPAPPQNQAATAKEFFAVSTFPLYAGGCVVLMFIAAVCFTLRELNRLAAQNQQRRAGCRHANADALARGIRPLAAEPLIAAQLLSGD